VKPSPPRNARKAKDRRPRRRKSALASAIKWIVGVGLVVLMAYVALEFGGVAYGEDALKVINFSNLTASQKRRVLQDANQARCTCGCGLGLAECVATDSTCPIRTSNIDRINTMVREARQ
jgi:hypothetical protein